MAKKDFSSGIDGLIQNSLDTKAPVETKKSIEVSNIKATYYFNKKQLETIKTIAYYDRKPIGEVISEALEVFIISYKNLDEANKLRLKHMK